MLIFYREGINNSELVHMQLIFYQKKFLNLIEQKKKKMNAMTRMVKVQRELLCHSFDDRRLSFHYDSIR